MRFLSIHSELGMSSKLDNWNNILSTYKICFDMSCHLLCSRRHLLRTVCCYRPCLYLQEHHEEDFFLYVAYSDESVYGAWMTQYRRVFYFLTLNWKVSECIGQWGQCYTLISRNPVHILEICPNEFLKDSCSMLSPLVSKEIHPPIM